jgi:hypothetical protein
VKDCLHQVEQIRQVGLGDHREHLTVQVRRSVIGNNEILELLEPFLGVEELTPVRKVGPKM